jgi:type I restriction enzyme S subunit
MGQSPPSSSYNNHGDGLPFFQGKTDFGDLYPDLRMYCNKPSRVAEAGDVLMSVRAPVGPTNLVRQKCCIGRGLAALRPKNNLDTKFLLYFLRHHEPQLARLGQGSTFEAINRDDLEETRIPFPDLSEQRRIAGELERADRLRRTRRYALELADTFLPAAFVELFGSTGNEFPISTVNDLLADKRNAIRTGPFGSQLLHSEFTDSGIAVLGIDNAVNNRFEWSERRFITPQKYEQLKRYTIFPGDVLITLMGTCGRCAIVPDGVPTAINTKHLCCITLDRSRCLPIFLHGAFLYHPFVRQQLSMKTKGSIMEGLNMSIIQELRIPLPPLPLQTRFAELVARHERLRAVQRESFRQAEHLFQTLLHQSFA